MELVVDPPIRVTKTGIISKPVSPPRVEADEAIKIEIDGVGNEKSCAPEIDWNKDKSVEKTIDADIIIWGTGFQMDNAWATYRITGRSGKTLEQHWAKECNNLYGMP